MNPLKLKFYLEVLAIASGIVFFICVMPLEIFMDGEVSIMSILCAGLLWYTIITRNETFYFLIDKWFK